MPHDPDPRLPSAAELALLAATLAVPALLWTLGHDFVIHAAVGQLLPLVKFTPGLYLLDHPLPKPAMRTVLRHVLEALWPGIGSTYEIEAHGRRWRTVLEPIRRNDPEETDPTRQILGVLATSVLSDAHLRLEPHDEVLAELERERWPEPAPVGVYAVMTDDDDVHAGDLVTCRRHEPIWHHDQMLPDRFDQLIARGILRPCDPSDWTAGPSVGRLPGSPGGRGRLGLHLA